MFCRCYRNMPAGSVIKAKPLGVGAFECERCGLVIKMSTLRKYGATRERCRAGHMHDSRGEAAYCDQLGLLVKGGEIKDYRVGVDFPLLVNGQLVCTHRVDFLVVNDKGIQEVHEYKGFPTKDWKLKRKLFMALYPGVEYIVIGNRKGR